MVQLIGIVSLLFDLYSFILLARVLSSWFQVDPYNSLVQWLYRLTEPLLAPIRRFLPLAGVVDFSPVVAFILIIVAKQVVLRVLVSLA
ncbi:MAG TPA: YggT family protein [Anaerolineae bacterium]|nr:YggT family protein [Anaerolineae bacterium]